MKSILKALKCACVGVVCAAGVGSLAGCAGYQFEHAYRTDVGTVAVPIFENVTYRYGIEVMVTEALIKEVHRVTPYRVDDQEQADTVLTGAITDVSMRTLTRDSDTGLAEELAVTIAVDFEWRDRRTGEVLTARKGFRASDTFVPDRDASGQGQTGEPVELGERKAAERLARSVVTALRSSW